MLVSIKPPLQNTLGAKRINHNIIFFHSSIQKKKFEGLLDKNMRVGIQSSRFCCNLLETTAAVSYFCGVDISRDRIVSGADGTGLGSGFIR